MGMFGNNMGNPTWVNNLVLPNQILSVDNVKPSQVLSKSNETSKSGLDMLGRVASIEHDKSVQSIPKVQQHQQQRSPLSTIEQFCNQRNKKKIGRSENSVVYVDKVRDSDILCGRGGRSNNHRGNKRYRYVIDEMRTTYQNTKQKLKKTDLSRKIVDHVHGYGGRFLKLEIGTGRYYVLDELEARKKTSQALREHKKVIWTLKK